MLSPTNISILLYALPVYQLLFYSIQLITLQRSNPSRRFLGMMLAIMTLFLILNFLYQLGINGFIIRVYPVFVPLLLTILPVFYLYVFSLIHERKRMKSSSKLVLFIPGFVVLAANLISVNAIPVHKLERFLADDNTLFSADIGAADTLPILLWLGLGLVLLMLVPAFVKIFKLLQNQKSAVIHQPSYLAYIQFKWLYVISVSVFVFIAANAFWLLFVESASITAAIVFNVFMVLSGGFTGYFGMKQDHMFTEVSQVGSLQVIVDEVPESTVYEYVMPEESKKILSDGDSDELLQRITDLMEQKKPYLEKRFSIADLSKSLNEKQSKVTYVINEVMDKNFYGLINEYRVREVIHIVENDNYHHTIDSIAEKVGFHSRSSFYACFKKYTGQTPKEFISGIKQVNYK
jgi:AraC-like DNA-binding protein